MSRTSSGDVEAILGGHYGGSTDLDAFILTAASLVGKCSAADTGGVHSASDLELIERWLAAHFYAHSDQLTQTRSTGKASATFQGQTAMVFNSTQYGQTALALDTTGYLAKLQQQAMTGPKKAGGVWLGTRMKNDNSETTADQ